MLRTRDQQSFHLTVVNHQVASSDQDPGGELWESSSIGPAEAPMDFPKSLTSRLQDLALHGAGSLGYLAMMSQIQRSYLASIPLGLLRRKRMHHQACSSQLRASRDQVPGRERSDGRGEFVSSDKLCDVATEENAVPRSGYVPHHLCTAFRRVGAKGLEVVEAAQSTPGSLHSSRWNEDNPMSPGDFALNRCHYPGDGNLLPHVDRRGPRASSLHFPLLDVCP